MSDDILAALPEATKIAFSLIQSRKPGDHPLSDVERAAITDALQKETDLHTAVLTLVDMAIYLQENQRPTLSNEVVTLAKNAVPALMRLKNNAADAVLETKERLRRFEDQRLSLDGVDPTAERPAGSTPANPLARFMLQR